MTTEFMLLVCGGRTYGDEDPLEALTLARELDGFLSAAGDSLVVLCGAASGADILAWEWAVARGVFWVLHPADWARHGRAAGPLRNRAMLRWRPDAVLAFTGGSGTQNMVDTAAEHGILVCSPRQR